MCIGRFRVALFVRATTPGLSRVHRQRSGGTHCGVSVPLVGDSPTMRTSHQQQHRTWRLLPQNEKLSTKEHVRFESTFLRHKTQAKLMNGARSQDAELLLGAAVMDKACEGQRRASRFYFLIWVPGRIGTLCEKQTHDTLNDSCSLVDVRSLSINHVI